MIKTFVLLMWFSSHEAPVSHITFYVKEECDFAAVSFIADKPLYRRAICVPMTKPK